jgi:hypothetical protein
VPAFLLTSLDRLAGGALAVAAAVALPMLMGPATAMLSAGWIVAFALWVRQGRSEVTPMLRSAYRLALAVLAVHMVEEWLTGFPQAFPVLIGAGPWTEASWAALNLTALGMFGLAGLAFRRTQVAFLVAWFVALAAGIANGAGHLALSLGMGQVFPGTYTAPRCLAAGLFLLRALRRSAATGSAV